MEFTGVDVHNIKMKSSRNCDDELSNCTDDVPVSPCSSTTLSFYSNVSEDPPHSAPASRTFQADPAHENITSTISGSSYLVQSRVDTPNERSVKGANVGRRSDNFVTPPLKRVGVRTYDTTGLPVYPRPNFVPERYSARLTGADFVYPTESASVKIPQQHVAVSSLPGIVLRPKTSLSKSSPHIDKLCDGRAAASHHYEADMQASSEVRPYSGTKSSRAISYSRPLDVKPPCADDFVQTSQARLPTPPPDFVRSLSQSSDALDVIACQPDLQVLLSGAVKSSALLRNNPDFIPPAVSPVNAIKARRRSLPEKKARDAKMQRFLDQRKVIHMDPESAGRCTHTEVAPSSMMTLAMELLVSQDNKASSLFKQAKKKADDEAEDRESILPNLWVVSKDESENVATTASHLKPCLKSKPGESQYGKEQPQNVFSKGEVVPEETQTHETEKIGPNPISTSPHQVAPDGRSSQGSRNSDTSQTSEIFEENVAKDLMNLTVADLVGSPDTVYSDTESELDAEPLATGKKFSAGVYIDSPSCTFASDKAADRQRSEDTDAHRPIPKVSTVEDSTTTPINFSGEGDINKVTNDMFSRKNKGRSQPGAHQKTCLSDSDVQPCKLAWSVENRNEMENHTDSDSNVDTCGVIPCSSPSNSSVLSNSSSLTTVSSLSLSSSASCPASPPSRACVEGDLAPAQSCTISDHREHVDHIFYTISPSNTTNSKSSARTEHETANTPSGGMSNVFTEPAASPSSKHQVDDQAVQTINRETYSVAGGNDEIDTADCKSCPPNKPSDNIGPDAKVQFGNESATSSAKGHRTGSSIAPKIPTRRQSFHRMKEFRYRRQMSDPKNAGVGNDSISPASSPKIARAVLGTDNMITSQKVVPAMDEMTQGVKPLLLARTRDKSEGYSNKSVRKDGASKSKDESLLFRSGYRTKSGSVASQVADEKYSFCDTLLAENYKEVHTNKEDTAKQNKDSRTTPSELICSKGHAGGTYAVHSALVPCLSQDNPAGNSRERVPSHNEVIYDAYYVIGNLNKNKQQRACCDEIPELHEHGIMSHMRSEGMHYEESRQVSVESSTPKADREALERQERSLMMNSKTSITNNCVTVVDGSKVSLIGTPKVKSPSEHGVDEQTRAPTAAIYMEDLLRKRSAETGDGYSNQRSLEANIRKGNAQQKYVEEDVVMPSAATALQSGRSVGHAQTKHHVDAQVGKRTGSHSPTNSSRDVSSHNAYAKPFVKHAMQSQVRATGPANLPINDKMASGQSPHPPASQYIQVNSSQYESVSSCASDEILAKYTPFDQRNSTSSGVTDEKRSVEAVTATSAAERPGTNLLDDTDMERKARSIRTAQNGPGGVVNPSTKDVFDNHARPASNSAKSRSRCHGYSVGTVSLSHSPTPGYNVSGSNKEVYSSCVKITLNPKKAEENLKKAHASPGWAERPSSSSGCNLDRGAEFGLNGTMRGSGSNGHGSRPGTFPRGQRSRVSNSERVRNGERKVREVVMPEKKVYEKAAAPSAKPDLPVHSTEDESDFAGVVDGPCKNVKEIRAMFRNGPDYTNYAKPKMMPGKPALRTRNKREEILGQSPKAGPTNEVAQQIIGLFKGALTIDVEPTNSTAKPDSHPIPNGEQNNNEPTISVKDKVASFNSGTSPVVENEEVNEKRDTEKEVQETLKLSTFAPYAEIISNPAPKTSHKPAVQPEKVNAESYDESLDQFYDILDELTAS